MIVPEYSRKYLEIKGFKEPLRHLMYSSKVTVGCLKNDPFLVIYFVAIHYSLRNYAKNRYIFQLINTHLKKNLDFVKYQMNSF